MFNVGRTLSAGAIYQRIYSRFIGTVKPIGTEHGGLSGVWFSKFLSGAAGYDTVDGSFTMHFQSISKVNTKVWEMFLTVYC